MNGKFEDMFKGVKVKRNGKYFGADWNTACKDNDIEPEATLTVSYSTHQNISFDQLKGYERDQWFKYHFEIVEEPKTVDKPTELEDLLKQIKTSIEVTEDARKAYYAAKAKSLELSKLLQQKLSNPSN